MSRSTAGRLRLFSVAALLALAAHAPAFGEAMSFALVSVDVGQCRAHCPQVIYAQGEIDNGSADALLDFVARRLGGEAQQGVVLLDSPGGHVIAAMELGYMLRKLGMAVIVARPGAASYGGPAEYSPAPARCYSACVYALMGGRRRVVWPQSRVAVHRMFNYATSFDLAQGGFVSERYVDDGDMRRRLARYTRMMGVSDGLIDLAERTSPDSLHLLTPSEIARWRLASQKP